MNYRKPAFRNVATEFLRPQKSIHAHKIAGPITLFALPKAFTGHTSIIQRNAIKSWCRLAPAINVILIGDEEGIAENAAEFGLMHLPQVARNHHGTPLVSSAFRAARNVSESKSFIYCNCDVILMDEIVDAVRQLEINPRLEEFLAIGRRTDLRVDEEIDFDSPNEISELRARIVDEGRLASIVCKEFFVFSRDMYQAIPDFAVGRGNWDNWMVAHARARQIPIVSLSKLVPAIHQYHEYDTTTQKSRYSCYVSGDEARNNQTLAGGRNLVGGSATTWTLTSSGPRKKPLACLKTDFWFDSHRFLQLVLNLLIRHR